jgi:hypothetical protein
VAKRRRGHSHRQERQSRVREAAIAALRVKPRLTFAADRKWVCDSGPQNRSRATYFVILDSDRTGGPYVPPWILLLDGRLGAGRLILACRSVITYSHETRERLLTALPCALLLEHPFYSIQITLKTTGWTPATLWCESMLCVFLRIVSIKYTHTEPTPSNAHWSIAQLASCIEGS